LIAALSPQAEVEIWTLFCGAPMWGPYSPLAQWLHGISGGATGSRLARHRRREDHAACRVLGAGFRHFRWQDVAYRRGRDDMFLYKACRQEKWQREDEPLLSAIAATLREELSPGDVLLVPLAIGRHVDHLIVRQAAEQSGHSSSLFYPEVPYLQLYSQELGRHTQGLNSIRYAASPEHSAAWVAGVRCYTTQIRMLEEAAGPLPELIQKYARSDELHLYHDARVSTANLAKLGFVSIYAA
jgi:LmbE family N-acetylglucosaminyl deacetylase